MKLNIFESEVILIMANWQVLTLMQMAVRACRVLQESFSFALDEAAQRRIVNGELINELRMNCQSDNEFNSIAYH